MWARCGRPTSSASCSSHCCWPHKRLIIIIILVLSLNLLSQILGEIFSFQEFHFRNTKEHTVGKKISSTKHSSESFSYEQKLMLTITKNGFCLFVLLMTQSLSTELLRRSKEIRNYWIFIKKYWKFKEFQSKSLFPFFSFSSFFIYSTERDWSKTSTEKSSNFFSVRFIFVVRSSWTYVIWCCPIHNTHTYTHTTHTHKHTHKHTHTHQLMKDSSRHAWQTHTAIHKNGCYWSHVFCSKEIL